MPRRTSLSYVKYGGKKSCKKRGGSFKQKQKNIMEEGSNLNQSWKSVSSSTEPNVAKKPTILERIYMISEYKGEVNLTSVENTGTSLNENENITQHRVDSDLQYSTEEGRTQEQHIHSRILGVDNFKPRLGNGENNQSILSDVVDNKKDYIAGQDCGSASKNVKEKQIQEERSKGHIPGLENLFSYLGNTEKNLGNNEKNHIGGQCCGTAFRNTKERQNNRLICSDDAIDLLFLGLAESVKTFSSERQANTKLKIVNLVLEQKALQRKEDTIVSPSLSESLML